MNSATPIFLALSLVATTAQAEPTIEQMRDHRRVLLVAAPHADNGRLVEQRRMLAHWKDGAKERDVSVIEVVGETVSGSGDTGTMLGRKWHLPPGAFVVILIGKDGHEALRSQEPVSGQALSARIDAMPMRRAGGR
jgi:hypothetical protein